MYVAGLVIPVPEARMDAYRRWAENSAQIFSRYGCLEIVECWEDYVPEGKETDFRRAVAAREGEKIVFAWQVWPDKQSLEQAEARMHADGVLDAVEDIPFDARRLIIGCFEPICTMGRT
ncbi:MULTISPECIES: DUF1428 domain-containing protein [Sphingobium]|uniref:Uncharacterized protein YbaA (DUF1428 family) n=1 Tax=Sphingobium lignivorans TaxID=2735886 RepID=A0ABR6NKE4_9SPHN|nr:MULTISPECIES: DUF1428 domain-containing protein [Sphingobium]MBB5987731.1 uncharacterized protein YbaA (DUF1428 family) [Sphingobium lignivorans]